MEPKVEEVTPSEFSYDPLKQIASLGHLEEKNPPKSHLIWVANNKQNVFQRVSGIEWIEKIKGKVTYVFRQVNYEEIRGMILHDPNRNIYVGLNDYEAISGVNEHGLYHLYDGKWVDSLNEAELEGIFIYINL
jgi:hypothetical protein